MTTFNKTSKCALSLLLAVMMLFSSVLTGADALTKTAQDTAEAAAETAVDTAAETAAEEAAEEEEEPEQEAADAAAVETSVKTDAAEVEVETVQTTAPVKKTPEKSGAGTRTVTIYWDNTNSSFLSNLSVYKWSTDGDAAVGSFAGNQSSLTSNMTLLTGSIYYCTISDATTNDFNFMIQGYNNNENKVQSSADLTYLATYDSDEKWVIGTYYKYSDNPEEWRFNATPSDYTPPSQQTYTVYFDTSVTGWDNVYAYAWKGSTEYLGNFPGTPMQTDPTTGLLSVSVSGYSAPDYIIFSNGNDSSASGFAQTGDLTFTDGATYTGESTLSGYYIYYGIESNNQPGAFNQYAEIKSVPVSYYAEIDTTSIGTKGVYFALLKGSTSSNYTAIIDGKNTKTYTNNSSDLITVESNKDHNVNNQGNIYFGRFAVNSSDTVSSVKIEVDLQPGDNPSFTTYTISATADSTNIYAKNGTIRTDYQKYAALADTTMTYADGSAISGLKQKSYYQCASVSAGDQIKVTTTIKDGYRNKYYVKAFCVNGVSFNVIDEPSSTNDGVYSFTYTVPSTIDTTPIEITPIYFYITESSANSGMEFVTFYAEGYGKVKPYWGNTLSVQAWYSFTNGSNADANEKAAASATNKSALGGYPGQPMVYANGMR